MTPTRFRNCFICIRMLDFFSNAWFISKSHVYHGRSCKHLWRN